MPLTKAVGINTDRSTSTSPITGHVSSSMAFSAAWRRESFPASTRREQSSTTTMASSTTMAIASTRPKSVRVLMVKPIIFITANVAMRLTGMVIMGMTTARQFCRNSRITIMTMRVVSTKVTSTSSIEAVTKSDESSTILYFTPGEVLGKAFGARRASSCLPTVHWHPATA